MRDYVQLIDTDTQGPRYDVTPLFADHGALSSLVEDLLCGFADVEFDYVVGIDALGFILGTAIAMRARKGFVPIRKGGKLPVETDVVALVDYTGETKYLELRAGVFEPGARVLLVDEWIETGAQVKAAIELIEGQAGSVAGIATINMDWNATTDWLREQYRCHTVWEAGDED
jgi:adenine phosphoribosyltransferase